MAAARTNSLKKGFSASGSTLLEDQQNPWKNVSDTEESDSSSDDDQLHVMVEITGESTMGGGSRSGGLSTRAYTGADEELPALPLRTPTADHAHFHTTQRLSHATPNHHPNINSTGTAAGAASHAAVSPPAVVQYPLPQAVSRESRHVSNMIRIFGSVDAIQHHVASGKNSGYVDTTRVNCDSRAGLVGSSTAPVVKHTFLPHLPLSVLLNDQPSTPRHRPETMESSFRGTPRSGRGPSVTPKGFTCDSAASTFFRINTPREPYRPPGTAASGKMSTYSAVCVTPREGLASRGSITGGVTSPRQHVPRPQARIAGDDVLSSDRAFVIAETKEFEKCALPQAREHRAYVRQMTADNLILFRSEQMTSALLRKMFHTKVALECEVAKKLSARGKQDMSKLAIDVKVAMNRLGLRQLDPLDFHTFLVTLLDDPSVPFSDSRYLFTLIDTNASKMIDVNELAEGLELLSMDEDQITLSFCQKLFAEPNKYRDVRLSYHEVVSIFRCVLAFYGANDDVNGHLRQAEEEAKQRALVVSKQKEIEIEAPPPPQLISLDPSPQLSFVVPPLSASPSIAFVPSPVQTGLMPPKHLQAKKSGAVQSGRLVKPTMDSIKKKLEAEVAAVVRQVWRFSASKGGQIHIPLLRTLMAADGPLLISACQAIPQSLKSTQSRLLKDLLNKETAAYEERLAALTGEADALMRDIKELKVPLTVKKANSNMSGMSDGARKAAQAAASSLHRMNEDFDSTLLKGRPLPYDEVAAIYEKYDCDQIPPESPKMTSPGGPQPPASSSKASSRRQSMQRGQSSVSLKPQQVTMAPQSPVAVDAPLLARRPTAILTSTGEVAADPWHPRFTADINKVNDLERQRSAREHNSEVFVSEGKIVLRVDENGVKIPWVA